MNENEMQQVDGGGWGAWAGLYLGVMALACPPLAVGLAVGGLALAAYDLATE